MSNGDFSTWENKRPAGWKLVGPGQKILAPEVTDLEGVKKVLGVEVVKDAGEKKFGEIRQSQAVKAVPNTEYNFSGWLKSSKNRACFFMIKLFQNGKEIKRITVGSSTTKWEKVKQTFNTGEADSILILCRYQQSANYVGSQCYWGKLELNSKN